MRGDTATETGRASYRYPSWKCGETRRQDRRSNSIWYQALRLPASRMVLGGGGKESAGDGSIKTNGNRASQGAYRTRLIGVMIRMTEIDVKPTWEPIDLRCKVCSHEWQGWQPCHVPVETWIAHIEGKSERAEILISRMAVCRRRGTSAPMRRWLQIVVDCLPTSGIRMMPISKGCRFGGQHSSDDKTRAPLSRR